MGRGWVVSVVGLCAFGAAGWMTLRSGAAGGVGAVWPTDAVCGVVEAGVGPAWDFFTNFGSYMPRTRCLVNADGGTDWAWVWVLLGLNAVVIAGYLRIFVFWRKAYLAEKVQDRNTKLMDLAWIFLFCATCGYVSSMVLFFWPGYRLLALMLVPLAVFTWRFAWNLESFGLALRAKRLERELAESLKRENEELERRVGEATAQLRKARAEAERANAAKSTFLANMSHEIRTPMTSIIGYTDMVLGGGLSEQDARESLETVRRNGSHLLGLINDILDLSRVEAGAMELERVACDPAGIARDVCGLVRPRAEGQGSVVSVEVGEGVPPLVTCDPTRVRQIVTNLAGNAAKFTRGGRVVIRVSCPGAGRLAFEVEDTGPGMSASEVARCFETFMQADASVTRRHGGSGLGLPIARNLARAMGGDVTVRSEPGVGSVFRAEIDAPTAGAVDDGSPEACRAGAAGRAAGAAGGGRGGQPAAADVPAGRRGGGDRDGGGRAGGVPGGVRGVAGRGGFDVILMDIQMPRMDGLAATRAIRAAGVRTPIIGLIRHAMQADRALALEAGCDAYHTKPVDFPRLGRAIGEVVAGRRAA